VSSFFNLSKVNVDLVILSVNNKEELWRFTSTKKYWWAFLCKEEWKKIIEHSGERPECSAFFVDER